MSTQPEVSSDPATHQADTHAVMVAPANTASPASLEVSSSLALINVNPHNSDNPYVPNKQFHPDQHWDGRRVTLSSWYTEFETTLSYVSPSLYEFAVNGMV